MPDGHAHWFIDDHRPSRDRPVERPLETVLATCRTWPWPFPQLVSATEQPDIRCVPICARRPPLRWVKGRTILIGDAAHAMGPALGQGANQAITDAVILGECLAGDGDIDGAVRRYERRRSIAANAMWWGSRAALAARATRLLSTALDATPAWIAQKGFARSIAPPRAIAARSTREGP